MDHNDVTNGVHDESTRHGIRGIGMGSRLAEARDSKFSCLMLYR